MAKNKPVGVVNLIDNQQLAKDYAKKCCGTHDDEMCITHSDYRKEIEEAFMAGVMCKCEWISMYKEKPKAFIPVLCRNDNDETVIGFYDKEKNGMIIYGYQLYDYFKPSDFGKVKEWKKL